MAFNYLRDEVASKKDWYVIVDLIIMVTLYNTKIDVGEYTLLLNLNHYI